MVNNAYMQETNIRSRYVNLDNRIKDEEQQPN